MVKRFTVSLNVIVALTLIIISGLGFILYQKHVYDAVFQEYIDLKWKSSSTEANLIMLKRSLEQCRKGADTSRGMGSDAGTEDGTGSTAAP